MPSAALRTWRTAGARALDTIEAAHAVVDGAGAGRRYARQQIVQAYAVLLSSQFQRFCRDLHSEAADRLSDRLTPIHAQALMRLRLSEGRRLDVGNPNPANIGSDFGRFGISFWPAVVAHSPRNARRMARLEQLNVWRNAIAHQDFDPARLGGRTELSLREVKAWRRACGGLARPFDAVLAARVVAIVGTKPW